jgi:tubulin monoglycylase TTLL15
VLISSIEPLRVYRYNTEMLVRFCPEPYHPFNVSNTRQYVIDESHTSITDMPSFRKYSQEFGFSAKKMFEEYMKRHKHDVNKFWKEIDEIITTMIGRSVGYLIRDVSEIEK